MATTGSTGSPRHGWLDWLEARFHLTETFSFLTSFGIFPLELDNRLPLRQALADARRRPMPSYMRFPRVLGLLAVQLFFFLGLTGAMLASYYRPAAAEAHAAVTTIVRDVNFGWLVHQSHVWAGRALVLVLVLRILRFFFAGIYRAPREGLWIIAVLALTTACLSDLTGRLLPLDQSGFWTTVRGVETLQRVPLVGSAFVFLLGGTRFDSLLLTRAYVLHLIRLPGLMLLLFHFNLVGLRRVGMAPQGEAADTSGTYRKYMYDLLILSVLVLGAIVTLATLWPQRFGAPVDPFVTPPGIRPPWYMLAPQAVLERLPGVVPEVVRGGAILAGWLLLVLVPFLDRGPWQPARQRRLALALGCVALAVLAFLTWQGYGMEATR